MPNKTRYEPDGTVTRWQETSKRKSVERREFQHQGKARYNGKPLKVEDVK